MIKIINIQVDYPGTYAIVHGRHYPGTQLSRGAFVQDAIVIEPNVVID